MSFKDTFDGFLQLCYGNIPVHVFGSTNIKKDCYDKKEGLGKE